MPKYVDDNGAAIPDNKVTALPTKRFFMSMLSRDIALNDAIMDLLDNCIDGIHRNHTGGDSQVADLYSGYFGDIILNENEFILTDNCGGIPLKTAKEYAFKMGRSEKYDADDELETIGMYGIGMKRAIFKMGVEAEIISHTKTDTFKVTIPASWSTTRDWYFDFENLNYDSIKGMLGSHGTSIRVTHLNPNIKTQFGDEAGFITDLRDDLQKHYGYIISQGFKLTINGIPITAIDINILTSASTIGQSIRPYFYSNKINDVEIDVIVGFYREPATATEIENELEGIFVKRSTENAGITVLCNDRIVLSCDRTYLTGWGDYPVPKYHTQFISIAGVVHFRSKNSLQLPVTTTKRGLDTSSPVYAEVKNKIKEGIKYFTDFTNRWKTDTEERSKLFVDLKPIEALKLGQEPSKFLEPKKSKRNDPALYQLPELPKPVNKQNIDLISINFKRHKSQVATVRDTFLDNPNATPNDVGGWCFDQFYSQLNS